MPSPKQQRAARRAREEVREALNSLARATDCTSDMNEDDTVEYHLREGEARRILEVLERWLARKGGQA